MAVLKDLIVHGASRFLNGINADSIETNAIKADSGIFNQLIATTLEAKDAHIDELTANNATVFGVMDVKGKLLTNQWEAASIANIGGNFYISPTGKSSSGTVTITRTSTATSTAAAKYSVTMSGTFSVSSTSSTIWTAGAYGMATGNVAVGTKKYPLGTCDGPLSNITTGTNTITGFTISNIESAALDIIFDENSSLISSNAISSKPGTDLQVSVYLGKNGSNYMPIGILLTSYGKDNKQYIDIYDGTHSAGTSITGFAEPTVRIGDLSGLSPYTQSGKYTITPQGWGIYTSQGYFRGEVYSEIGYIGGFTINGTALYNGSTGINNNTSGVYLGYTKSGSTVSAAGLNVSGGSAATTITFSSSNFTKTINGTSYSTLRAAIGSNFGMDSSGNIYANGANITSINAGNITAGDIAAARIQTNLITAINAKVSDISALSATLGGFQVDSTAIHTKNVAITSNADNSIALSSADFTRTINSVSRSGLRFAIGDKLGITGDGIIYATGATISGALTATSLTINSGAIIGGDGSSQILNSKIEVGGRNLFGYGSQCESKDGFNVSGTWDIATEDGFKCMHASGALQNIKYFSSKILFTPKPGESVTLSAYVKIKNISYGTTNPMCEFYFSGQTLSGAWRSVTLKEVYIDGVFIEPASSSPMRFTNYISDTNWHYVVYVATWPNYDFTGNLNPMIYFRDATGDLYVRLVKYERGTKATDWSPAPEDIDVHRYVTDIDSNNGITIKAINGTTDTNATTGNYIKVNADGLKVYKGGNQVASYGTNALIGREASGCYNILIDATGGISLRNNTTARLTIDSSNINFGMNNAGAYLRINTNDGIEGGYSGTSGDGEGGIDFSSRVGGVQRLLIYDDKQINLDSSSVQIGTAKNNTWWDALSVASGGSYDGNRVDIYGILQVQTSTKEADIVCQGANGSIYMYASYTSGNRGFYGKNSEGTNEPKLVWDDDNICYLYGSKVNSTANCYVRIVANTSNGLSYLLPASNTKYRLGNSDFHWDYIFSNNALQISDKKKKIIVDDFDWKVDDFIRGLRPVAFKRIKNDKDDNREISRRISLGFIAQDVSKLSKNLKIGDLSLYNANILDVDEKGNTVEKDYHGEEIDDNKLSWSLNYSEFIAPMVLEIQQLMDRVDTLESEIKRLKS